MSLSLPATFAYRQNSVADLNSAVGFCRSVFVYLRHEDTVVAFGVLVAHSAGNVEAKS